MDQPAFRPEPGDLERKVEAVFAGAEAAIAAEMLHAYQPTGGADPDRVRLAAVYVSGGSLDRLRDVLETARIDWRDVLVAAEYRSYFALPLDADPELREAAIREDWDRYSAWVAER